MTLTHRVEVVAQRDLAGDELVRQVVVLLLEAQRRLRQPLVLALQASRRVTHHAMTSQLHVAQRMKMFK